MSVCVFLSVLQACFKLKGYFGFLFGLFVCSVFCNITRLCHIWSDDKAVFFIMLSNYFHSLKDVTFNNVGWKIKSLRNIKNCFSGNIALQLHGRRAFLYYRLWLYMLTFPARIPVYRNLPSLSSIFLFHWNLNMNHSLSWDLSLWLSDSKCWLKQPNKNQKCNFLLKIW